MGADYTVPIPPSSRLGISGTGGKERKTFVEKVDVIKKGHSIKRVSEQKIFVNDW